MALCHLAQSNDWHVVNQANKKKNKPIDYGALSIYTPLFKW
jgi:hypothetical protein